MTETVTYYRLEPTQSRFTVQVFASGLLSFVGRDPTFSIRDFEGEVTFGDDMIANMRLDLRVRSRSLALADGAAHRGDTETRMNDDVLDVAAFPNITYMATAAIAERVSPGRYRVGLEGTLTIRGFARPHRAAVDVRVFSDGIRIKGDTRVRMSEYNIPPVAALGGTIRLKDEAILAFDLVARPDAPEAGV